MVTNFFKTRTYDSNGEPAFEVRISKEDRQTAVKFVVDMVDQDGGLHQVVEFQLNWGLFLRFVKSCFAAHVK